MWCTRFWGSWALWLIQSYMESWTRHSEKNTRSFSDGMEMQRLHKNQRKHLKPRKANVQCFKSKGSVEPFSCFVHVVVFFDDHIACAVLFPRHVISTKQKLESSKSLRPNAKLCTFLEVYGVGKCMCSYSIDINTQPRTKFTRPTLLPHFGLFFE